MEVDRGNFKEWYQGGYEKFWPLPNECTDLKEITWKISIKTVCVCMCDGWMYLWNIEWPSKH